MSDNATEEIPVVRFNYTKSSNYRIVKADGAWGAISARGEIMMSIFTERPPIPDFEEYRIPEGGGQLVLTKRETRAEGMIREVEVSLAVAPQTALTLARWLFAKAKEYETLTETLLEDKPLDLDNEMGIKSS